jgi:hypothetical protein
LQKIEPISPKYKKLGQKMALIVLRDKIEMSNMEFQEIDMAITVYFFSSKC